jgi:hypothetical protein
MNTIIIKENNKILGHIINPDLNFFTLLELVQESYSLYKKYENPNDFILDDYVDFHNIIFDSLL